MDVVKEVFFTMKRILWSSITVFFHGHPGLFISLNTENIPDRMYKTVDLASSSYRTKGFIFVYAA